MFYLSCTSDRIWNLPELIEYLVKNQNKEIHISIVPEAICLHSLGLYQLLSSFDFSSVTIHTFNPFEQKDGYNIIYKKNFWFEQAQTIDTSLHSWNLKKKFLCFYHRPTASRLGLASYLFLNYKSDSHIHFSATIDADNLIQFELDKLLSYDVSSVSTAGALIPHLPLLLAPSDRYTHCDGYYYDDPLTNLYKDILIDVVVESHVKGKTFFPTEKTLRPMWLKKPFIVFGSQNYLNHLRQMGFKTFQTPNLDFWSEDYDGYEGRDRYLKILAVINELSKKSKQELQDLYNKMQPILDHNYNLLQTQSYSNTVTEIV